LVFSTASTAWLSEYPGATLNEMVTTGNCPWWLIVSGEDVVVKLLIAESGTGAARGELEDEPDPEEPEALWLLDEL
jgi:hypothetical protein